MSIPTFLSDRSVTMPVEGVEHRFYPVSVKTIFRLKTVSKTIAKSIQALLSGGKEDTTQKSSEIAETAPGGAYQKNISIDAISPELAELRYKQKQKALEELVDTVLSEDSSFLLVDMIADSMRDAGFPKNMSTSQKAEWVGNCSATALVEMIIGVIEANKSLFSPLGKWGETAVSALKNKISGQTTDEPSGATLKMHTGGS